MLPAMTASVRVARLFLPLVAFLVGLLARPDPGLAASGDGDRVVAVLYFDNNTGDKELDVMKKGFADMMITDLAEVDGLTVVERDKLQALLDEIKLQKSPYFDKKTAMKLGKGLGASHAVTGSFQAGKPKLRIDVRLIEIATGKVVVTSKVTGSQDDIFELEQQLVEKFVASLERTYAPSTRPRTKVPDVDTLVEYSKGIDLADRGKYEDAEKTIAKVVQRAPTFALARLKRDEIIKRMEEARKRRENIQSERGADLAKNAEDFLRKYKITDLNQDEAQNYLAYRLLRGRFLVRALAKHMSTEHPWMIKRGQDREARRLLGAIYANYELLIAEHDKYAKRYAQTNAQGGYYLDTSFDLPRSDEKAAREADIEDSFGSEGSIPRATLAEFLLLGKIYDLTGKSHLIGPPLAEHEPKKYRKLGFQLLEEAWRETDKHAATTPWMEARSIDILETYADALLLRDDRDKGIAKLQEILDRYPTSSRFKFIETRIQKELGLAYDNSIANRERYYKSLKTCDDMDLRVGWGGILYQRARLMGMDGIPYTIAEMEKNCKGKPRLDSLWQYVYSGAATYAGRHDDCELFNRYIAIYVQLGGGKSSAEGYRKNYSHCPVP